VRRGRVSGVSLRWLRERFANYPPDADEGTVTHYCRAWVLNLFGSVLFPDATRDSSSWMYIHCLWDWDDAGACHTRFYKKNRMHLTCAPRSFYTHMIDKTRVIPLQ
jgi:hypothetical protein